MKVCYDRPNRSEPRKFTASDACRIAKYAAENETNAIVMARLLVCLGRMDQICQLLRFVSASMLLLEAVGEIAAVSAVGVALEKIYRLLMGAAGKVPQIRVALAAIIVAIIFLRSVVGAIEAMFETSEGVRAALDDLQLLCQISQQDE